MTNLLRGEAANTVNLNYVLCRIFGFDTGVKVLPESTTANLPVLTTADAKKFVCFDTTENKLKVWDGDSWEVVAVVS